MTVKTSPSHRTYSKKPFTSKPKPKHPKWHDQSCYQLLSAINRTTSLLTKNPRDPWLKGKLMSESKSYKKLLKTKQKQFINSLFSELESLHSTDPRGYMNLVKALRNGNHDKTRPPDTDAIDPEDWFDHFSNLLGKAKQSTPTNDNMTEYIKNNIDLVVSELDSPFTIIELRLALQKLKNNKAPSFDKVTNEMIKIGFNTLAQPFLLLFNSILANNIYPTNWKYDLLGPIHKGGPKDDCNNYRGICVSSCIAKLFNTLLRNRLEKKCSTSKLISKFQLSGKKNARTSDHLLVLKHIIDKYIKTNKSKLFVCFFDLRKAFDTVDRTKLFYNLLVQYNIGGKFLHILKNMYTDNKIFIKLNNGLTKPFVTTTGVKQGCVLSPILFNLFINKLPECFSSDCDPVYIENEAINCLMWADDCVVLSKSAQGLQLSINATVNFFKNLGLEVNSKKTQVMIFNPRGHSAKQFSSIKFYIENRELTIADSYVYLGLIFKPSGSVSAAIQELQIKASKAWFSISNTIYQNKKMSTSKALQLVDSLVTPIGLYACEFWTPLFIPNKHFESQESLLKFWEGFIPENLNQRICRMLLSVHKKSSRLAVLGEIARYPLFLKAIIQCLKYEWHLTNSTNSSLVHSSLKEMKSLANQGYSNWLSSVQNIKKLLNIPKLHRHLSPKIVGKCLTKHIHSYFDIFYLRQINKCSFGDDGLDHNKLRFYKTFKGSFTKEPYIEMVKNRNQRAWLSRLQISSHHLGIETGRWAKPSPLPINERLCKYCSDNCVDNETHFLLGCATFSNKTRCFEGKLSAIIPGYNSLNVSDKISTILCPTSAIATKLVNKYVNILFKARKCIDSGDHISGLTFPPTVDHLDNTDLDTSNLSDLSCSDLEDSTLNNTDSSFLSEIDF